MHPRSSHHLCLGLVEQQGPHSLVDPNLRREAAHFLEEPNQLVAVSLVDRQRKVVCLEHPRQPVHLVPQPPTERVVAHSLAIQLQEARFLEHHQPEAHYLVAKQVCSETLPRTFSPNQVLKKVEARAMAPVTKMICTETKMTSSRP